jgi:hypothetical protein
MRRAKRALAASFVMTFAAGCDSKATAPAIAPTVDVGTPTSTSTPELATVAPTATPPLPPAPSTGHVARRDDGSCMWFSGVQCPHGPNGRIMPCNPPAPHRVQCPDDAGP